MWKYLKEKALFFTWSPGPGVFCDLFFLFGLVEFLYKPWTMLLAFWSRDVRSSACLPIVILNRGCTFVPTLKRLLRASRLFLLPQCMQEPLAKHSAVLRPTLPGLLCAFPCAAKKYYINKIIINSKEKMVIWLMVTKVSVHGQLAYSIWACMRSNIMTEIYGRGNCSLGWEQRQERSESQYFCYRHAHSNWPH